MSSHLTPEADPTRALGRMASSSRDAYPVSVESSPAPADSQAAARLTAALQAQDISKQDLAAALISKHGATSPFVQVANAIIRDFEARHIGVHGFVHAVGDSLGPAALDALVHSVLHARVSPAAASEMQDAMAQQRSRCRKLQQLDDARFHDDGLRS
eukprot:Transcript_1588.p1 GENE.Transcript_1588~~Transcript_1588.p1  ORF type:complete len:167 (-),score=17.24 Transcript_1588:138-608(-)